MQPIAARLAWRPVAVGFLPTLILVLVVGLWLAPARSDAFTRGFADSVWVSPDNPAQTAEQWDANAYSAGARIVEVEVDWGGYEPARPKSRAYPASPASSAYDNWQQLDQTVENLAARHVQVMFLVTDPPSWAQADHGRDSATEGYKPNSAALRAFVQALATRYSGHYPNPAHRGRSLPRVRYYQAWAEANMSVKLAPQWVRVAGRWDNVGATTYRALLNAFYAGVKSGDRGDTVIFTGLAPYGDPTGGQRVPPVTFLENVLCLNAQLVKQHCSDPAHFDVLAADPYDVGPPTQAAYNATDASAPDLGKLTRIMRAAVAAHTVYPDAHKPLWVTEFSYDSNPPNPNGVSTATQARWLEQSLYVFWKEGVSTVFWYLIRDSPGHDYASSYFSGVYFFDGKKKPSLTAYKFPLVVAADGARAQVWGIAPATGTVLVQYRAGHSWHTVFSIHRRSGAIFTGSVPLSQHGSYRAVERGETSLSWVY